MKTTALAFAFALAAGAAFAADPPVFASGFDDAAPRAWIVEFKVTQFQHLVTVTCATWFAHTDLNNYGGVEGSGCNATEPLLVQGPGTFGGHVHVTFAFADGSGFDVTNCRVTSHVLIPGYDSVAVDCL